MQNSIYTYFFLALYGCGLFSSQLHLLADLSHKHAQHDNCSAEIETNICHLATVHYDSINGCTHNTHYKESKETCSILALYADKLIHFIPKQNSTVLFYTQQTIQSYAIQVKSNAFLPKIILERGPPQLFS